MSDSPLSPPKTSRAYRWYVVGVLMTISMLGYVDRLVLGFLIDPIKNSLSLSDTQAGLVSGLAFSLFYVMAGMPLGRLVDTKNRKRVLSICITAWSLATALCGMAYSFVTLFLARIGVGVGEAALNPSAVSIIADLFPRDKVVLPISIFTMGFYVGGGLAIMLGGQLVDYFASMGAITMAGFQNIDAWRLVFISVGAPGIVAALIFYLTVKEPERHIAGAEDEAARASMSGVFAFLAQNKRIYSLLLGGLVANGFFQYSILAWFPVMLTRTYGVSAGEVAVTYGTIFLCAGVAGALSVGPMMRFLTQRGILEGPAVILLGSAILMTPFAIAGPLMPSMDLCLGFFAVSMFCWATTNTTAFAAITQVTPNAMRGLMISVYTVVMNLGGGALATVFVGLLSDYVFGTENVRYSISLVSAIFLPICALIFAFLRPVYRRYAAPNA